MKQRGYVHPLNAYAAKIMLDEIKKEVIKMAAVDSKKLAPLRILQILNKYSDAKHPLTQEEIATILENEYGIVLERKAIGRDINLLVEAEEFGIVSDKRKGTYVFEHKFMNSELRVIIDSILTSKYITERHSKDLVKRISELSNIYFENHVQKICSFDAWGKTENQGLFLNVEEIGYAIKNNYQIEFDYNKYGADKKLHQTSHNIVSPYMLITRNQRYYVLTYHERYKNITMYRIDHITNIKVLTETRATDIKKVPGYEKGIDQKKIASTMPYMFSDEPVMVTFTATSYAVDQMVDWFGYDLIINELTDLEDGKVRIVTKVSPLAMEYLAMQYLNDVEVEVPISLRNKIKENLEKGLDKYK